MLKIRNTGRWFMVLFLLWGGANYCNAQSFSGLWKGNFTDTKSKPGELASNKYVLDLKIAGEIIKGTSYTYFTEGGKEYYSICLVYGKIYNSTTAVIQEIKRIKTNLLSTEAGLQVHNLSLKASNNKQVLMGTWARINKTKLGEEAGKTYLIKSIAKNIIPQIAALHKKTKTNVTAIPLAKAKGEKKLMVNGGKIKTAQELQIEDKSKAAVMVNASIKQDSVFTKSEIIVVKNRPLEETIMNFAAFKKRNKRILQTISTVSSKVKIDIYDNGEIDGDSISLFFNDKVLLSRQMLKNKAINIELEIPKDGGGENELVMFAENLGTIPPNTALMVITDGNKRYEIRIISDLQQSGAIKFLPAAIPIR